MKKHKKSVKPGEEQAVTINSIVHYSYPTEGLRMGHIEFKKWLITYHCYLFSLTSPNEF